MLLLLSLFTASAFGQNDITGSWHGVLNVQGMMELRIIIHLNSQDGKLTATMDSPDQKAFGIPVAETTYNHPELNLNMPNLRATYKGLVKDDFSEIAGDFLQAGMNMKLVLKRDAIEKKVVHRPQEPKAPFPYYVEEVTFKNESAGNTLAGTLTLPNQIGNYPVVVLVSGSGPQDRNEELLDHKPFLVLSDYLTRQGIGVLRYDDRGVGLSTGNFASATSEDFATDALAAVQYLKTRPEVNPKYIGIAGHSEGGLIAPMVAAKSNDVGFIVLLAGPGVRGKELLALQIELISKAGGQDEKTAKKQGANNLEIFNVICKEKTAEKSKPGMTEIMLKQFAAMTEAEKKELGDFNTYQQRVFDQLSSPWMRFFLCYDPALSLRKVKCPVLAVNGDKDMQVDADQNLRGIQKALKKARNKNVTVHKLKDLNHLFQTCETGSPSEYAKIEETMSPGMMKIVSDWILALVK